MNEHLNLKIILTVAIVLAIGGTAYMLMPQALQRTLFGQLDKIYTDFNLSDSKISMPEDNYSSFHRTSQLPSYKIRKNSLTGETSNVEPDFTASTYSASIEQNKTKSPIKSNYENNTKTEFSYNYNQQPTAATNYSSNARVVLNPTNVSHSGTNFNPSNNELQPVDLFGAKSQFTTNHSNNSFVAYNTLSITTDLSENNSALLVGGDSNPGDPGIPVGDGVYILIAFLVLYSLNKNSFQKEFNERD